MPEYIVKLKRADKDWFLVWSTIVDAPLGKGQPTIEACKKQFSGFFSGMFDGLQFNDKENEWQVKGIEEYNCAGKDETFLSIDEVIDQYCEGKPEILGKIWTKRNSNE